MEIWDMSKLIANRLEELGMNTHQLSKICGMANSYIIQLIDGRIYSPGRDKLIRLGLALHWDIKEINELLKEYKHEDLAEYDVSYLMEAVKNTKIGTGLIATRVNTLSTSIFSIAKESIPGPIKFISGYPPYFIWNNQYVWNVYDRNPLTNDYDQLCTYFQNFIISLRKQIFDKHLMDYEYEHLICKECFNSYIHKNKKVLPPDLIIKHFRDFFYYILCTKYDLKIITKCPRLDFLIKKAVKKQDKSTVIFLGKVELHLKYSITGSLHGFITSSEDMYRYFTNEYSSFEKHAIPESNDKKELVKYIIGMLHDAGIEMEYDFENAVKNSGI